MLESTNLKSGGIGVVRMRQFSDDTQHRIGFRFFPAPSQQQLSTMSTMSDCVLCLETWFTSNRVKLNVCKSEFFYTSAPNQSKAIEKLPLRVADDLFQPSQVVKTLR